MKKSLFVSVFLIMIFATGCGMNLKQKVAEIIETDIVEELKENEITEDKKQKSEISNNSEINEIVVPIPVQDEEVIPDEKNIEEAVIVEDRYLIVIEAGHQENGNYANEAKADAFIRVHANGSENSSISGMITICQTSDNPYNADLYPQSRRLSELVLNEMAEATGASANHIWETDTMSGINWAQVPTTIVEMGYMTNPEEDQLMATEEYQFKIAQGIANGIDLYFEE